MQVLQECNKGRRHSKKLIDDIDPSAMKQLENLHEIEQNQNKNMILVEKIGLEDYLPEESGNQLKTGIVYNFSKDEHL